MTARGSSTASSTLAKATLFCPNCGHESRVDGDWRLVRSLDAIEYQCPDCRTIITARPETTRSSPTVLAASTVRFWRESVRAWHVWLDAAPACRTWSRG